MSNLIKTPRTEGDRKVIRLSALPVEPETDELSFETDPVHLEAAAKNKINKAKREAGRILEEARQKARHMDEKITENERRSQLRCEEAYRKSKASGYRDGYDEGVKEGVQSYRQLISKANEIVDDVRTEYSDYLKKAEPDILNLSMAVAEKIVNASLSDRRELWKSLVAAAIKEVRDQNLIKITVAPSRFDDLKRWRGELEVLARDARLFIYADSDYGENDCTVETGYGKIDAGTDSQLMVIRRKLTELLEG